MYLFDFPAQDALILLFTGKDANINDLTVLKEVVDMPVRLFSLSQVPLYPLRQVRLGASNIDIKARYKWKGAKAPNLYTSYPIQFYDKAINSFVLQRADCLCAGIHYEQDINR